MLLTDLSFAENVADYGQKLEKVISALSYNHIFNVSGSSHRERIDIRYFKGDVCDCLECCVRKLRFVDCLNQIPGEPESFTDLMKLAYVNYQLCNFPGSAHFFMEALKMAETQRKSLAVYLISYNLTKLRIFVRNNYYGSDARPDLIALLDRIDTKRIAQTNGVVAHAAIIDLMQTSDFYTDTRDALQESVSKIVDQYYSSLDGGWSSNGEVSKLISTFANFETFLNANYIVFDKFDEFKNTVKLFAEGVFASHAIADNHGSRLEFFDDWLMSNLVYYGDADTLNKFYRRYKIKKVQYKKTSDEGDSLEDLYSNFFTANAGLRLALNEQSEPPTSRFWDIYNRVFSNLLALVSMSDFPDESYDEFARMLFDYTESETYIRHHNYKHIRIFLARVGEVLSDATLHRIFKLALTNSKFHTEEFLETLWAIFAKKKIKIELTPSQLQTMMDIAFNTCPICNEKHRPDTVVWFYLMIANDDFREVIENRIKGELENEFDFRLYYSSAIFGIIDFDETNFQKAIDTAFPQTKKVTIRSAFTDIEDQRWDQVNDIINLAFKYDLDTTADRFEKIRTLDPYYEWLLDMEGFDYSKFNGSWIGEYTTRFYFRKIANSSASKKALDNLLKEDFSQNFAQDYLNIYVRKTWNEDWRS